MGFPLKLNPARPFIAHMCWSCCAGRLRRCWPCTVEALAGRIRTELCDRDRQFVNRYVLMRLAKWVLSHSSSTKVQLELRLLSRGCIKCRTDIPQQNALIYIYILVCLCVLSSMKGGSKRPTFSRLTIKSDTLRSLSFFPFRATPS